MLAFPERVLAGDVPNRDFLHLYGPGSLWVLAGVFEVFGATLATERLFGLAPARRDRVRHLRPRPALGPPARHRLRAWWPSSSSSARIGLTALAWNGAVALGLCGLAARPGRAAPGRGRRDPGRRSATARRGRPGRPGPAVPARPRRGHLVGLGAVAWGLGRDRLKWLLGGGLATLSLYVVHLARAGIGDAFEGMFVEPVFELRGGRSLPLPPSWDQFDGFLQKAAGRAGVRLAAADARATPPGVHLVRGPAARGAGRGGRRHLAVRAAPEEWRSRVLFAAGLFGVGLLPQALQRPDTAHLAWVSCVPLALAPLAITELVAGLATAAARPGDRHGRGRRVPGAGDPVPDRAALRRPRRPELRPRRPRRVDHPRRPELLLRVGRGRLGRAGGDRSPRRRGQAGGAPASSVRSTSARTPYSEAFFYYLFPELTPGDALHRDGPGHRQRRGLGSGRRGPLRRLADPVRRVVRLGRAERLPDRRTRRAEPGGARRTSAWSTSTAPVRIGSSATSCTESATGEAVERQRNERCG